MSEKINLAFLITGSGTTLQNFIDKIDKGDINANIQIVISSRSNAYGLERAVKSGIGTTVIDPKDFNEPGKFSQAITSVLDENHIDLVLLAGFSHFFYIHAKYVGKVINIHPSLIPSFCGKGFYGRLVHKAVIDYGAKVSGCTVHFADNQYDTGPVILQRTVDVKENDTPETLAERVFEEECIAYPEAVR
ncbi:MAG: phosphoribosylglycinamide formyltransferase, partial [Candidatus Anammoxibacter sp.]